jgi:hypothetical protein
MGECVPRLNDDLSYNHRCSMNNGLLLNPNKTKAMFICHSRAAVAQPPVVIGKCITISLVQVKFVT